MRITKKGAITGAVAATLMGGLLSAGVASAARPIPGPNSDDDTTCVSGQVCVWSRTGGNEHYNLQPGRLIPIHGHYGQGWVCNFTGMPLYLTNDISFSARLYVENDQCFNPIDTTPYNYIWFGQ